MYSSYNLGVLALQGAFIEHISKLKKLGVTKVTEVRKPEDIENLDGLIIPGGESTTIGKIAQEWKLLEPLRKFVKEEKKPLWGTCAGMIMIADNVTHQKEGGQPLIGGLDVEVDRNHFGRQLQSFESLVEESEDIMKYGNSSTPAVFIRAPCVMKVGPGVKVLAKLPEGEIVAVQQNHLLATAFHPELTSDTKYHQFFLDLVKQHKASS
eukprot:TRINITY_DN847_c0_g1_i1.p1 TRINITY_DN847_c0_g1~~TRINITY_DN847_c0_g1_i1.p1  ORF type:complete len:209 (-),score=35.47 TRINITY_DN847_c0_g1_i1:718-1344(-)